MATFIWCEIVCRNCAITAPGQFTSGVIPRERLKQEATKSGFAFFGDEAYCKTCAASRTPTTKDSDK